jgi:hypothetical protein
MSTQDLYGLRFRRVQGALEEDREDESGENGLDLVDWEGLLF